MPVSEEAGWTFQRTEQSAPHLAIPTPERDNVASSLYRLSYPDSTYMRVVAVSFFFSKCCS